MLRIHILDVGHGDSIVLEYRDEKDTKSFAVIDSYCKSGTEPKALSRLKALGANSLSFVAITHPHADHYMGMRAILEHFANRIDTLYTFPIKKESAYIERVVRNYKKFAITTDSELIRKKSVELAYILKLASSSVAECWEDPAGAKSLLTPSGFSGVTIHSILPPARVKGDFFQRILDESIEPENDSLNNLSMAFLIEYAGQQIVLAGDGTYDNWHYQSKQWNKIGFGLSPVAVKLPHHGSKHDCDPSVQNVVFGSSASQQKNAVACISANGKSHPAPEVLDELTRRGILPYCTNISTRCNSARQSLLESAGTDQALLRFIGSATIDNEDDIRPCQGDIVLELTPGQPLKVTTQYGNLCALRGDYDFMSTQVH